MNLRPFFCYYGGKWRAAPHYPAPRVEVIVEPFAGAAGYSTRYPDRKIYLYDTDPVIVGLWQFLVRATRQDILSIPERFDHVDEIHGPQEARWLAGFWLNKGTTTPCKKPGYWMRRSVGLEGERYTTGGSAPSNWWGTAVRERIAEQVQYIKHWSVGQMSYADLPGGRATWFVDPPYQEDGHHYRHHAVDYTHLAEWCRARDGQVIVCEQEGATWLPFEPFREIKSTEGKRGKKKSKEVIWTREAA